MFYPTFPEQQETRKYDSKPRERSVRTTTNRNNKITR